jgi:hypothetical protein
MNWTVCLKLNFSLRSSTPSNEILLYEPSVLRLATSFTVHELTSVCLHSEPLSLCTFAFSSWKDIVWTGRRSILCMCSYFTGYVTVPACVFNTFYRRPRTSVHPVDRLPQRALSSKFLLILCSDRIMFEARASENGFYHSRNRRLDAMSFLMTRQIEAKWISSIHISQAYRPALNSSHISWNLFKIVFFWLMTVCNFVSTFRKNLLLPCSGFKWKTPLALFNERINGYVDISREICLRECKGGLGTL